MNSAKLGTSAKHAPRRGPSSHVARDDNDTWATIVSPPTSSRSPAGTQWNGRSLSGLGTGEPQVEQKSDRKPDSFTQERIARVPLRHLSLSLGTMVAALASDPPCRLH